MAKPPHPNERKIAEQQEVNQRDHELLKYCARFLPRYAAHQLGLRLSLKGQQSRQRIRLKTHVGIDE
jgi:hypothetical protein